MKQYCPKCKDWRFSTECICPRCGNIMLNQDKMESNQKPNKVEIYIAPIAVNNKEDNEEQTTHKFRNNMDSLCGMGSIVFGVLAIVCLLAGILNDAFFLGFLGCIVCIIIDVIFMSRISSETWKAVNEEEKRKQYEKLNGGYKCPNCGMNAGHKISTTSKAISVSALGLASDKIGKTYKCENCDYMW